MNFCEPAPAGRAPQRPNAKADGGSFPTFSSFLLFFFFDEGARRQKLWRLVANAVNIKFLLVQAHAWLRSIASRSFCSCFFGWSQRYFLLSGRLRSEVLFSFVCLSSDLLFFASFNRFVSLLTARVEISAGCCSQWPESSPTYSQGKR